MAPCWQPVSLRSRAKRACSNLLPRQEALWRGIVLQSSSTASEDAVTAAHTYMYENREARVFDRVIWIADSRSERSASPFRLMSATPVVNLLGA